MAPGAGCLPLAVGLGAGQPRVESLRHGNFHSLRADRAIRHPARADRGIAIMAAARTVRALAIWHSGLCHDHSGLCPLGNPARTMAARCER